MQWLCLLSCMAPTFWDFPRLKRCSTVRLASFNVYGVGFRTGQRLRKLHPIYTVFLRLSSKDTSQHVDASLCFRIDIDGDSDAEQESISAHEESC
jgi:hypothetical protein